MEWVVRSGGEWSELERGMVNGVSWKKGWWLYEGRFLCCCCSLYPSIAHWIDSHSIHFDSLASTHPHSIPLSSHSLLLNTQSTDQHDCNKQDKRIKRVILQRRPEWEESPPWKRYRMDFPSSPCTQCRNALEQKLAHPTINRLTPKKVHQNSHKRHSANSLLHSDPIYDHPSSSWGSTRTAQTPR